MELKRKQFNNIMKLLNPILHPLFFYFLVDE